MRFRALEIAWPFRQLLRQQPRRHDPAGVGRVHRQGGPRQLRLDDRSTVRYDALACWRRRAHALFGHDASKPVRAGLKTLEEYDHHTWPSAHHLRGGGAESEEQRRAALDFVIVGRSPLRVELAGTIAELARDTLPTEFRRRIDTRQARIVLVEAGPRVFGFR